MAFHLMKRKKSMSCRKTTESCSLTSCPALACWDVWLQTTASPCSPGKHLAYLLILFCCGRPIHALLESWLCSVLVWNYTVTKSFLQDSEEKHKWYSLSVNAGLLLHPAACWRTGWHACTANSRGPSNISWPHLTQDQWTAKFWMTSTRTSTG